MSAKPLSIDATFPLTGSQHQIPQIGFGVYLSPKDVCVKSCKKAFDAGYRHIDTAQYYANEEQVGQALAESGLPRKDVYITSKVLSPAEDVESTYKKVAESVEKLAGKDGYADLFLVHSPNAGKEARKTMWLALVLAQDRGKVRDIGVSNYGIQHIEEISTIHVEEVSTARKGAVLPVVNQIELHPWCQQREIVDYCKDHKIVVEAYCPLVRNEKANDETLVSIAKKHNKEPNQILIRWSLQKGFVPLPKSDTPSRIVTNADVYSFELDKDDMDKLDGLDQGVKGAIVQAVSNA
ncbi:ARA1 Aldo keto reductase related to diketogulonate reductase [Pyrenophora tritici-repentis]|uniref:2,5-diketo-D-gluconic acid reductase A n=2 Tax=Pyrenophora tritici-repentis TaxID=45151 RepID=A0A2W1E531_9PLEO|nr:2,5-diketo-D-gluconic acid reductase A [Pyrenophora tritici-repentis Pt-1C-BFP]KAA8623052.1 2 5-diketo-D-gluconic acid reductase A [Pyrenophora tritici-repentis]EDU45395.1 2,5-diketo-D-gluconic acid reductase A [Pyrenophora tritici-repentis Pt-1C-BFP]KAF7452042.1 2-5-diketo-D-gluconic acid reductase A [Pyrenophora tritici-repentis]KAF7574839.1 ARA1, Aldo-keto reductase, related to diketogulonate reductase [Pyrenophora tritici-repentis]KAG9386396.1 2,5-diketo-D-gluconic acid reductase A [Pyr